jgi:hypothetical protein
MIEVTSDELRDAIERMHGCPARLIEAVPVSEAFQGRPVWDGEVHVFALQGHRSADRCYAWSSPIEGSDKRRFYAVLHMPPVNSAADAVRAAIVQDYREKVGRTPGQPLEPAPSKPAFQAFRKQAPDQGGPRYPFCPEKDP